MAKPKFLISQKVDNLHVRSVIHPDFLADLHGAMTKLRCTRCGKKINKFTVPKASSDVRPIQGGLPWGCKLQGSLRSKKDNRSM
ncbi:MAG: Sir2 family NAD-dependent protein deacetylase, partial [Thermodesulfobacteriota bacterium]